MTAAQLSFAWIGCGLRLRCGFLMTKSRSSWSILNIDLSQNIMVRLNSKLMSCSLVKIKNTRLPLETVQNCRRQCLPFFPYLGLVASVSSTQWSVGTESSSLDWALFPEMLTVSRLCLMGLEGSKKSWNSTRWWDIWDTSGLLSVV